MDLESQIGSWGRFQAVSFGVGCLASFMCSLYIMSTVFTTTPPKHRCYIPDLDDKYDNFSDQDSALNYLNYYSNFNDADTPTYGGWFNALPELRAKYYPDAGESHSVSASMCNYCPDGADYFNRVISAQNAAYSAEMSKNSSGNRDLKQNGLNMHSNISTSNNRSILDINVNTSQDNGRNTSNNSSIAKKRSKHTDCAKSRAISCDHGLIYDRSQFKSSLSEYFDMACDSSAWKRQLASSLYMAGLLLGSLFLGLASDRFGRRPTLLFSATAYAIASFGVIFMTDYVVYCLFQTIIGMLNMGVVISSYCLSLEFIGKDRRSATGIWFHGVFTIGYLFAGAVGYLVRDWKLVIAWTVSPSVLVVPTLLFLPRSVLWLERRGRHAEALAIIRRIQRFNGMTATSEGSGPADSNAKLESPTKAEVVSLADLVPREIEQDKFPEDKTDSSSSGYSTTCEMAEERQSSTLGEEALEDQNLLPTSEIPLDNPKIDKGDKSGPCGDTIMTKTPGSTHILGSPKTLQPSSFTTTKTDISNRKRVANDLENLTISESEQSTSNISSITKLFSHHIMARHTLVICAGFTAASMTFYGISLNLSLLPGNLYLNYTLSGLLEFPGQMITVWLLNRVGRRWTLAGMFIFSGCCNILSAFIPSAQTQVLVLVTILGKVVVSGAFNGMWAYAVEVFPTEARSSGIGVASCMARIGSIISPQIALLAAYSANWVPFCVYGVVTLIAGLFIAAWAPETRGKKLPQTVSDSVALAYVGKIV